MAICIFPGTFNPIHNAHIKMAEFVIENLGIEKVIFIPSYLPPHKDTDISIANHRYNMVKLAIQNNPRFEISDIEYKLSSKSGNKSYTITTAKNIIEKYEIQGRLNMIIGTDAFSKIRSWYKADELKNLVHFIVFPRETAYINKKEFSDFDFEIVNSKKINLSSTDLRKGSRLGLSDEVKDYITKYGLYNCIH